MAAFGGDDALGAMMAATLPRSTMSKDQMQSIANGARPKTARPKTARPKKETTPWTKEDVTKLKKACKEVPSTVEKQQRWRQISGIVGRGKRECYDKYKELKEAQKTKNELKTMTRAKEGSTFEERLAALGLKEPAADAGRLCAGAGARRARAAASPSARRGGAAAEPAPTQTRRRPRTFGAEDLVHRRRRGGRTRSAAARGRAAAAVGPDAVRRRGTTRPRRVAATSSSLRCVLSVTSLVRLRVVTPHYATAGRRCVREARTGTRPPG